MTTGGGSATPPGWYPNGPAWPPPPPPPPPPSRRGGLVALVITLGVLAVVVVAIAATLLVVRPWSDDGEPAAGGGDESSSPSEPTGSTTTAPVSGAVRGDLDGDGRGDVLGRFYDETEHRLTLSNADGTFELGQQPVETEEQLVVGEFDGESGNDVASWVDASGTLELEVADSDLAAVTEDFDLWFLAERIKAVFGDFDGDGLVDVAAYGQQHRSQVSVWVLRNTGTGFEAPQKWASLPNATYGSTELVAGDFNGDGRDDALAVVPDEPLVRGDFDDSYWYGDFGVVPLLAEPGAFGRGEITPIEVGLYDQEHAVGDFDGDGKDTLVADDYLQSRFVLYEYDGRALRPTGVTIGYEITGDGVMDALTAVDLDGNDRDDLVFTSVDVDDYSFFGVWASIADGDTGGLDAPVKWAELPDCSDDYCDVDYYPAS